MVVMATDETDTDDIKSQIESIKAAISDVEEDVDAIASNEPTLDTKQEAFEYYVTEHTNLYPAERHNIDIDPGEGYTYYDCTGETPDKSNIGADRTDAADYLSEQGYSVTPLIIEEWRHDEHDLLLKVSVEEA